MCAHNTEILDVCCVASRHEWKSVRQLRTQGNLCVESSCWQMRSQLRIFLRLESYRLRDVIGHEKHYHRALGAKVVGRFNRNEDQDQKIGAYAYDADVNAFISCTRVTTLTLTRPPSLILPHAPSHLYSHTLLPAHSLSHSRVLTHTHSPTHPPTHSSSRTLTGPSPPHHSSSH